MSCLPFAYSPSACKELDANKYGPTSVLEGLNSFTDEFAKVGEIKLLVEKEKYICRPHWRNLQI